MLLGFMNLDHFLYFQTKHVKANKEFEGLNMYSYLR